MILTLLRRRNRYGVIPEAQGAPGAARRSPDPYRVHISGHRLAGMFENM